MATVFLFAEDGSTVDDMEQHDEEDGIQPVANLTVIHSGDD
jgi:hypothetical protein